MQILETMGVARMRRRTLPLFFALLFVTALFLGIRAASPVSAEMRAVKVVEVREGDGFVDIARKLREEGIIRSEFVFKLMALATGAATDLKPGAYHLDPGMSMWDVTLILREGVVPEVLVTIPEGASHYQIDRLLAEAGVLTAGDLIQKIAGNKDREIEGRLFPDSYRFYRNSDSEDVVSKMRANFNAKAGFLLARAPKEEALNLILASLLEREVPDPRDRRIVAGILKKRLAADMPLQVDASICYVKQMKAGEFVPCTPITQVDLKTNSRYNTYLNRGLPPGPIGNPGVAAIEAAMEPISSSYWFYLSDPVTGKTIFSQTLDEHNENRVKYFK